MTRTEHLLTILAEECAEVAQRASKALRFGPHEKQPGQDYTNLERIEAEMADLLGAYLMIADETKGMYQPETLLGMRNLKKAKVEKFLNYSRECGTLRE
jgi:NTP pyrophosphatase (non-canonical NTP hydrolase)